MTLMKGSSLINWILNLKWLLPRLFFFWNLMWIASFTLGLGESDIPVLFLDKRLHPYNINRNSEIEIPEASGCWWSKMQQQESLALMDHRGNLIWRCTNAAMEFHPLKLSTTACRWHVLNQPHRLKKTSSSQCKHCDPHPKWPHCETNNYISPLIALTCH